MSPEACQRLILQDMKLDMTNHEVHEAYTNSKKCVIAEQDKAT